MKGLEQWGPTVLRLMLGTVWIVHGVRQVFPIWGGGLADTSALLEAAGVQPAVPLAVLAGALELMGGVSLVTGAFTVWFSAALAIYVSVTMWLLQAPGVGVSNPGIQPDVLRGHEYNLLMLGGLVSLVLTGAGAISIDSWRAESAETAALGRARIRAGKM